MRGKDPSTNFGETAKLYSAFRPAYPPEVFEFLLARVTSGRSHAVDLGAGSGQATAHLAELFDHVNAVEPDGRLADEARLPVNSTIDVMPAEHAAFSDGSIDAVISATAFHWMDQVLICSNVVRWLKPGGAFFPFAFDAFAMEGAAGDFYAEEFSKWTAYRDRRLVDCYDYEAALSESGVFASVAPYGQKLRHEVPSDIAAGLIATFSYVRDFASDNGGEAYFQSLKNTLESFGDKVVFTVPITGALGTKG